MAAAMGKSAWFGRPGTLYVVCCGDEHFALVSLLGATAVPDRAGKGESVLSAGRIFRVLALPRIPDGEKRCETKHVILR